ncbi:MAG TPA: MBL fold metallo-hydrolase [Candidatus Paceibacterota bacterium]
MEHFQIQEIRKDIYLVQEPLFYEHANLFLVRGLTSDLLVDCGLGIGDIKEYLGTKGFMPKVFLTHSHFDHAAGARHFKANELLVTKKVSESLQEKNLAGLNYLRAEFFAPGASSAVVLDPPATETYVSENIDIGGYIFDVIAAPGHTEDSSVLYDKTNKLLITGDALYDGEVYADFPNSNKTDFLGTLAMLKELEFELVLPGHNKIMDRAQALAVIARWTEQLSRSSR